MPDQLIVARYRNWRILIELDNGDLVVQWDHSQPIPHNIFYTMGEIKELLSVNGLLIDEYTIGFNYCQAYNTFQLIKKQYPEAIRSLRIPSVLSSPTKGEQLYQHGMASPDQTYDAAREHG